MHFQNVTFENPRGNMLAARLDLPDGDRPVACALFAHCFTCSKNLKAVGNISRALTDQGFAVLRFDFTGLGESEGDFAETTFSTDVEDLVAAARYMEHNLDAPSILIGHSLGGAAVLQAASDIDSAKAVATVGAPFDPGHVSQHFEDSIDTIEERGAARVTLSGRTFTVTKQFVDDLAATRMEASIGGLDRALMIFHSPVDQIVGIDNAAKIFQAAKHPKSFVSLDQADHLLMDESDSRYVGAFIGAWARKYVDLPPATDAPHDDEIDHGEVRTETGDGYRTKIQAGTHAFVADEPTDIGGTDTGPTPYDLLLAALGSCTGMTLRMYADRKEWPLRETTVRLEHAKVHAKDCEDCEKEDGKIDRITREIEVSGDLDDTQRERLLEIANKCPVHRTLHNEIRVVSSLASEPSRPERSA
jgi:putative redox protein